jgi:uncharacterized protein (DUF58 family)
MSWLQSRFHAKGFLPGPFLGFYLVFANLIALGGVLWQQTWLIFLACNVFFILLSLLDLALLPKRSMVRCSRSVTEEQERDKSFEVTLSLENKGRMPIHLSLIDELPAVFFRPFPLNGVLPAETATQWSYTTKVTQRGAYELNSLYLRYHSRWRLWEKEMVVSCPQSLKVVPNLDQVRGHLTQAQHALSEYGAFTKLTTVGSGEFSQIRAYIFGDDPRKINWHQTAKTTELMTNVYLPEHGKQISILIDCGRVMGVELKQVNRLEKALEAALTVAALALRWGDYVSVTVFSNTIQAYVPPGNRFSHLRTIIDGVYAVRNVAAESSYEQVLNYIESVQKRQSLILMFSDLDPFLLNDTSLQYALNMRRKHLFLLLGLQNPALNQWSETVPTDTKDAMLKTVSQKALLTRKERMKYWTKRGVNMVEVEQEHLAGVAVDYYIQAINRGRI